MRLGRSMRAVHHGTPLVVRASMPRTFLGLGIFAEASLIFAGVYLLSEVLRRPLEAQEHTVISASVLLSLATVLLFYLVRPKRHEALAREDDASRQDTPLESPRSVFAEAAQARHKAERAMVDAVRLPGPM